MRFILVILCLFTQTIGWGLISDTYCVLDGQSKRILRSKQHLKKRAPASTVKLLTAMVVVDHIDLDKYLTTSKRATRAEPSKIYLRVGEKMRCRNLLVALLLKSANDVAVVLAESVAGSQQRFAVLMNKKAKQIGCKQSNFVTPNGLPAVNQYSCAYDLALIALMAGQYNYINEVLQLKGAVVLRTANNRKITVKSHNRMLHKRNPVYGKTGWTRRARHTFAGYTVDCKMAIAVMGAVRRPIADLTYLAKASGEIPEMRKIQEILKQQGYYTGKLDGIYGPLTRKAIKQFQQKYDLKVDGIVGPNTWKKLSSIDDN